MYTASVVTNENPLGFHVLFPASLPMRTGFYSFVKEISLDMNAHKGVKITTRDKFEKQRILITNLINA